MFITKPYSFLFRSEDRISVARKTAVSDLVGAQRLELPTLPSPFAPPGCRRGLQWDAKRDRDGLFRWARRGSNSRPYHPLPGTSVGRKETCEGLLRWARRGSNSRPYHPLPGTSMGREKRPVRVSLGGREEARTPDLTIPFRGLQWDAKRDREGLLRWARRGSNSRPHQCE